MERNGKEWKGMERNGKEWKGSGVFFGELLVEKR